MQYADSLSDYIDFAFAGAGEVIPTMGSIMLSGVGGAGAAKLILKNSPQVLQKKVVGKALQKEIKKLTKSGSIMTGSSKINPLRTSLIRDKGKAFSALGPQGRDVATAYAKIWGSRVGTVSASGPMGIGEVYNSMLPFTQLPKDHKEYVSKEDALAYSWMFGSAIGALDSLLPSLIGGKVLRKFYPGAGKISPVDAARADNYVKKNLLKAVGLGMAIEGSTEAGKSSCPWRQTSFAERNNESTSLGDDLGTAFSVDFSDQELWRLVDAGVLGMIGGGGASFVATVGTNVALPRKQKAKAEQDEAVASARLQNAMARADSKKELEDKLNKVFTRKNLEAGDRVILPNGRNATFIRSVGDGKGTVGYEGEDGNQVQVTLPLGMIVPDVNLESNIFSRRSRVAAVESLDERTQAPSEEAKGALEELKKGAEEEKAEEEAKTPTEPEVNKKAERQTIDEDTGISKGDMLKIHFWIVGNL